MLYGGYTYVALVSNIGNRPTLTDSINTWEAQVLGYTSQRRMGRNRTIQNGQSYVYKTGDVVRAGGDLYIAVRTI